MKQALVILDEIAVHDIAAALLQQAIDTVEGYKSGALPRGEVADSSPSISDCVENNETGRSRNRPGPGFGS